jgi:multidrug efflux pump subunit AcrA (membrane-fusion protein)
VFSSNDQHNHDNEPKTQSTAHDDHDHEEIENTKQTTDESHDDHAHDETSDDTIDADHSCDDKHDCSSHAKEVPADDAQVDDGHDHSAHDEGIPAGTPQVDDAHDHAHDHAEGDANVISLGEKDHEKFGIHFATAQPGKIDTRLSFPGEIKINEDRMAHIVPRAAGIVREVLKTVGDRVKSGEVLAWIESAQLAEAKVDYLTKLTELGCCQIDLTRAEEIHQNTSKFIDILKTGPTLDDIRKATPGPMGENRSKLTSAYAEYVFAREAYNREKGLFEKQIASEEEFLAAESAYKKADANYTATLDSCSFEVERELFEARSKRQVQEMELLGAERTLHVLGLSETDMAELTSIMQNLDAPKKKAEACTDPNCKDCAGDHGQGAASLKKDDCENSAHENLGLYAMRAPFDGVIIEKHLTLGEKLTDDANAFTISDMASVWIDIRVYQKDLPIVKKGQTVYVKSSDNIVHAQGDIKFVSPVMDSQTRTALARIVLSNDEGTLKPGMFVNADIIIEHSDAPIVVPQSAVQNLDGEYAVFVADGDGITPAHVATGKSNGEYIEILSGLEPGQRYVVEGAFELKAQIITSGMDPHAGHNH